MTKLQVFDPPMCCSSGVCGASVDTKLVQFMNDIEWLKKQGIDVERHGLAFEPAAFANNEIVKKALKQEGNDCLPLVILNNEIVYKGGYPDRGKLAEICKIEFKAEDANEKTKTPDLAGGCGADCDCHKSAVGDNSKKILFVLVLLIIAGIIAFKFVSKSHAYKAKPTIAVKNSAIVPFGSYIESTDPLSAEDAVSFVFIPSGNNASISNSARAAALSSQKILNGKNVTVNLYTLKTTSPEYPTLAGQVSPPAILVIKGQGSSYASGSITQTRILQAYMTAVKAADCGAGCPCH